MSKRWRTIHSNLERAYTKLESTFTFAQLTAAFRELQQGLYVIPCKNPRHPNCWTLEVEEPR